MMSLLKLAAEQNEKEKSKKRKYAEVGAMAGGAVGATQGALYGYRNHDLIGTGSRGATVAKNGLGAGIGQAIGGGLMGLAGGAVADHMKKKKKKKAETE